MNIGSVVLVPRQSGGKSFGQVVDIFSTRTDGTSMARVNLLQDNTLAVITRVSDLESISDRFRVRIKK